MEEMMKILEEDGIKFKPVLSTRGKACQDCKCKEDCNQALRNKQQIISIPKMKNCLVI